jgi:hypothetical protein
VLVSLIYLAVQIRQNTRSTRASTVQSVVADILGINLACAQDPELSRAYQEGMENSENLSEADQRRVAHIFFGLFKLFESMRPSQESAGLRAWRKRSARSTEWRVAPDSPQPMRAGLRFAIRG